MKPLASTADGAMTMKQQRGSWVLTEEFWNRVAPLLPARKRDPLGRGRPAVADRAVFAGILYVLRTGCQWKAAPKEFGSGSTLHLRFQAWERAGVFEALWRSGLAEYDDMQGIVWRWQAVDGAMTKAPMGGEATGANPTDRGKKGDETAPAHRRTWRPTLARRQRGERA
jgi:transposase